MSPKVSSTPSAEEQAARKRADKEKLRTMQQGLTEATMNRIRTFGSLART